MEDDARSCLARAGPAPAPAPRSRWAGAVVTSRDVARVAGVSQSTVSYVMSGRRSISAETRKRVLDAIEQLAADHGREAVEDDGGVDVLVVALRHRQTEERDRDHVPERDVLDRARDRPVQQVQGGDVDQNIDQEQEHPNAAQPADGGAKLLQPSRQCTILSA
jgi:transcriptional regulator with XRE-family HTH domain